MNVAPQDHGERPGDAIIDKSALRDQLLFGLELQECCA
jgi:hypothetical protein